MFVDGDANAIRYHDEVREMRPRLWTPAAVGCLSALVRESFPHSFVRNGENCWLAYRQTHESGLVGQSEAEAWLLLLEAAHDLP